MNCQTCGEGVGISAWAKYKPIGSIEGPDEIDHIECASCGSSEVIATEEEIKDAMNECVSYPLSDLEKDLLQDVFGEIE